jgi:hypothetical protein
MPRVLAARKGAPVKRLTRLAAGPLVLLVAAVVAAPASAATLKGTVVHRNTHAHSFVIAMSKGRLAAVHSSRSPRTGRVVRVTARRLRNGTYAASRVRTVGRRRHVRMRGTVTWVSRRGTFALSSRGASLLIHRRARGARAADDSPPAGTPVVGRIVEVDADVNDEGDIEANDVNDQGEDNDGIELEGRILAVNTAARTLSVSADDDNESGAAVTVSVPAAIDITRFHVGDEVELNVTRAADGTFVLTQASGDDNEQEADDNGDHGDHHDGGDHGGGGDD